MKLLSTLLLVSVSLGCAHKKAAPKLPNLEIPVKCASKIVMKQCDTTVNPPKCKSSLVVYNPPSCAIVELQ